MDEELFVEITKKAHKITRQMKAEFPEINYRTEFVICFKMLYEDKEKNKNKINFKSNNVIKKNNTLKSIKIDKELNKDKSQGNKKFKNVEQFQNTNKIKFNKNISQYTENKENRINHLNKEINFEKGSKYLLHKGKIEIVKIFKDNEVEMIEYVFVNSGIIQVTTEVTLTSNILKHARRKELKTIDTCKIDTVNKTIKEEVEILNYTYL